MSKNNKHQWITNQKSVLYNVRSVLVQMNHVSIFNVHKLVQAELHFKKLEQTTRHVYLIVLKSVNRKAQWNKRMTNTNSNLRIIKITYVPMVNIKFVFFQITFKKVNLGDVSLPIFCLCYVSNQSVQHTLI